MELLVVTLAHTVPGRDVDGLTRVRLILETVRNAPGLVNARFYRGRGPQAYYFLLTTWEDEEFWHKAEDRYSPKDLLLGSERELLAAPPKQWLMQYLWGYSRPSAQANIAAAHVLNVRPEVADHISRSWIESLRRQAAEPTLAFAFLARGRNEPVFLNVLNWPGETHRQDFYADQDYKAIHSYLSRMGIMQVLGLDPL